MGLIKLRRPWTEQPQGPLEPNPYWLSRGLTFLQSGASLSDYVAGSNVALQSVGATSVGLWQAKYNRTHSNATRNRIPPVLPLTMVAIFKASGTFSAATYPTICDLQSQFGTGGRGGWGLGVGGDLGGGKTTKYLYSVVRNTDYTTNERLVSTTNQITQDKWYLAAARLTAADHRLTLLGVETVSGVTATPGPNSVDPLVVGTVSGTAQCQVAVAAIFSADLSDAELNAIANDPLSLFAPRTIHIPLAAAAGGGLPTLSNARATSITTTTAVPAVDYAY